MEISSEARLHTFSIGATSLLGRAITLRLLLGYKMSRLFSGLHPLLRLKNSAQAILIGIAVLAIFVKRFPRMRTRAQFACRRKFWGNMMRSAMTYEEWAHAAMMMKKDVGREDENDSTSPLYDEELVRAKLGEMRSRREEGDMRDVAFSLRADLVRNLGNMCNPRIHKGRLQVPKLIKDYIDEVSTQLKMICDCQDLLLQEKLAFMHEIRHAYGRTALLLSGGSSLGAFHIGVVKTLIEHKLLPRVIAGSSVGSIMCSIIATRSWPELESFFENSSSSMQFFDQMGGIFATFKRIMTLGAVHDITQLQRTLRHLTTNLTFQEAYDMTGRVLGITVCSLRKHEPPRCLNYLTSPNVVIWSAVTASCAFPGLFEAQELMAKDRFGEIVPFHVPFMDGPEEMSGRSARRWRDGSLEVDLPMMQLKELFNVNNFIVSQANPHVAPLLRVKELVSAYGGNFGAKLAHLVEMEVKHRCNQFLELGCPLGGIAKLFAQDWEGDVTVVMPATLAQYSKLLQNPSYMELQKAINQGRRCTWEKLSAIKANCSIEIALDECVTLLNHMWRLKRNATRAAAAAASHVVKVNPSRRIPSWNRLARENSTSSIEDGFLSDTCSLHQMTTSQRAQHPQSVHYGSDSESESIDLHSWTRSGGPLMRTDSATKFIQDLEIEQKEDEIDGSPSTKSSSSSIVVAEGDLLQPEMSQNGIVLNIVKSADSNARNRVEISENFEGSQPEEVVDNVQMESCNNSVGSECGEDDEAESRCNDRLVDARNEASY